MAESVKTTVKDPRLRCIALESELAQLTEEKRRSDETIAELAEKVRWFEEQHRLALHKRFGASSEKTDPNQFALFNEAEAVADPAAVPCP